ncbi:DUF2797 domain-containing protein [Streptomyces sp. AK02-01A]|uniref:DUF2797 domain-containing protein n=1 Tax=Streptomyces sp. AK02-01A TaxID=3028648 RepID=UPI0029A95CAD|nr:DUF2797 domain-containing protein [Streptomyces sp. AK02-01A]MDX3854100.1 DUF2797 domain-containing protein [Streptomyces sp. AK02-01A]
MGWRCVGLRWRESGPVLVWRRGGAGRESPLAYGRELGFRAVGARECAGARGNVCPVGARVAGRSTGGKCPECARLDRAHSVAADTVADDPRTYRVYLAWFGPGMVKVGITAEERGPARLLEQGAVAFSWLGRGPLMAARRTEELLRTALGVPDRIPYAEKRAVRSALPSRAERAAEIERMHARAVALEEWPRSLERTGFAAVDHAAAFALDGLAPATGVVVELVDGGCVAGRLVAAAGPDLHLATADGGLVVFDTRLLSGWELAGVKVTEAGPAVTVPVRDTRGGDVQDGLF